MERYIEAEALKKVMCEGCDNVHLCNESPACETVQQIDAQPTADVAPVKHGQWIPCSERLPEEQKKSYWVCTDSGYQCQCRWTNVNHFWTQLTTAWHWHFMDIPQYTKVVAWMPLPEPYKMDEVE